MFTLSVELSIIVSDSGVWVASSGAFLVSSSFHYRLFSNVASSVEPFTFAPPLPLFEFLSVTFVLSLFRSIASDVHMYVMATRSHQNGQRSFGFNLVIDLHRMS